jgi:tubulin polyglutamylase TTLL2
MQAMRKVAKRYEICSYLKRIWICKPVDMSRGRGIFLVRNLQDLTYDTNLLVQAYVDKPLLISGYKFDMRVYVMVRSFHPLVVYMYADGLTRFATKLYDTTDLNNVYSHLTNTSINKHSSTYSNVR